MTSNYRKSARLAEKAETVQLRQRDQPSENKKASVAQKTTKKAQGRDSVSKKQKISNEKNASNDNAFTGRLNQSRIKGKEENSKFMKDIPFDVLLEIFSLLRPDDLLYLSRVSTSLYDLLTSKNLIYLWKSAYMNVDLYDRPPLCPDETNIVSYTNFVYGRHCQFCGSYGHIYHETAFIRLCSKCADNSFLSADVEDPVTQLCNQWTLPRYEGRVVLNVEFYLRSEEFKHAMKEKRVESYRLGTFRVVDNRRLVGHDLVKWRERVQRFQLAGLRKIRQKREADIVKKLEEEGYKYIRNWAHSIPHVCKSQELTESEWNDIRADIIDSLQKIWEDRALFDMRNRLEYRISHLDRFISQWKIRPTAWWVATSEPIASFMKSELPEEIPKGVFEKVEPQIRNVITSWKEETDSYLATLIPQPSGKVQNSKTSALELATTFFKCYWCREPISYPRILVHGCLLKKRVKKDEGAEEDEESDMEDFEWDGNAGEPRDPRPPLEITPDMAFPALSEYYSLGVCAGGEGVSYDEEASNVVRDIITVCGQDPKTVTFATMEEMHARVECLRCSQAMQAKQKRKTKSVRLVMKWTMALVHELEEHYGEPPSSEPVWRKIDSLQDLAMVKNAETHNKKLKKYQISRVSCNHCPWTGSFSQREWHIAQHVITTNSDVNEVTIDDHFSPPVDTLVKILYPAVKI